MSSPTLRLVQASSFVLATLLFSVFCMIGSNMLMLGEATAVTSSNHAGIERSSKVHTCPILPIEDLKPHLKSQQKEDVLLLDWFNGLCNGTYVEMGALDGVRYSNTFVFNKSFGWKGILVEISPTSYKKLAKNRPNELATVNAAVCTDKQEVHWFESADGAISGIWEYATESYRKKWWRGTKFMDTTPISCCPLQDILDEHAPSYSFFDIFSLDVEGSELEVLLSLDFTKVSFGIIIVESSGHDKRKDLAVEALVRSNGYFPIKHLGNNVIFASNEFSSIYQRLVLKE
jgi:FkbM family methyltransferase